MGNVENSSFKVDDVELSMAQAVVEASLYRGDE